MSHHLRRKALLEQRLGAANSEFQYYHSIYDALPVMVVITDGEYIFDANHTFTVFFAKMGVDVYDDNFILHSYFEKKSKYGYLYEGFQDNRWYISLLEKEKDQYRVMMNVNGTSRAFNVSLSFFEPLEDVFIVTFTDVTDLVGYKNALEEGIKSSVKDREKSMFMLRQYDRAIDSSTLVLKLDLEGRITYANKAISKVLKYTSDELIGQKITLLNGPGVSEEDCNNALRQASEGEIYHGVVQNQDKEKGLHYFDHSVVPLIDIEGNVVEYLSIRHEITDVMQAKEVAIKTLEAKTKFFDQVSHELRTPLNAIINFTDQSLENYDEICQDEETRELVKLFLQRSYKNSEQLLHLINSLLNLAKLNAGKEEYEMANVELVQILQDLYDALIGLNNNDTIEFILTLPDEPVWIVCDDLKMRQILTNLISNAFKFTEWGFVEVRMFIDNQECIVEIEDSGVGIPEEKLETIFDPFVQVNPYDKGTGLGLGIVNEYCKGMGMTLEVESEFGAGSCFRIRIPFKETL